MIRKWKELEEIQKVGLIDDVIEFLRENSLYVLAGVVLFLLILLLITKAKTPKAI